MRWWGREYFAGVYPRPAYVAGAYFGDMLQGQVSLFNQCERDQAKISRKRFYIWFSLLTP